MDNVYVLQVVWQTDVGECGNFVRTYSTIEKAQKQMKEEMETARIDFCRLDTEEEDYIEGDMSWSIWEKGEYCFNHIDITITECEVE